MLSILGEGHKEFVEVVAAQAKLEIEKLGNFSEEDGIVFNLFGRKRLQELLNAIGKLFLFGRILSLGNVLVNKTVASVYVINS